MLPQKILLQKRSQNWAQSRRDSQSSISILLNAALSALSNTGIGWEVLKVRLNGALSKLS